MHFKREPGNTRANGAAPGAFWLRDDNDQIISFRDKAAAEQYRRMVEESEAYRRVLPAVPSDALHTHLCEFDNNGYVIELTVSQTPIPPADIIELSASHP